MSGEIITFLLTNGLSVMFGFLGSVFIAIALVGQIPALQMTPRDSLRLGTFGVILILAAFGAAWLEAQHPESQNAEVPNSQLGVQAYDEAPRSEDSEQEEPEALLSQSEEIDSESSSEQVRLEPSLPEQPTPELVRTITVLGDSNTGKTITFEETGTYIFEYVDGAYSTMSTSADPWLTAVLLFKGSVVPWDGQRILSEEAYLSIADTKYWETAERAENSAKGLNVQSQFNKGESVTLVAVDSQSYYFDNEGSVTIEIWFLPGE